MSLLSQRLPFVPAVFLSNVHLVLGRDRWGDRREERIIIAFVLEPIEEGVQIRLVGVRLFVICARVVTGRAGVDGGCLFEHGGVARIDKAAGEALTEPCPLGGASSCA